MMKLLLLLSLSLGVLFQQAYSWPHDYDHDYHDDHDCCHDHDCHHEHDCDHDCHHEHDCHHGCHHDCHPVIHEEVPCCGPAPVVMHARTVSTRTWYPANARVQYACHRGFRHIQVPTIHCLPTGRWEPHGPMCVPGGGW